jgi:hypothetical protein
VWPVEIPQFSARNLNHHPGSELGALEVEFGPLPMGKPDWWNAKFDPTQFQKKYINPSSYLKVMTVLPKHVFWKTEYDSESKSGKVKTCYLLRQRLIQWMERIKQGFTMNLGLVKREFT